jgi:uroporphyrinogen-III synthase
MRVLLPQSDLADDTLASLLRQKGVEVITVRAYQTQRGQGGADLLQTPVDALTFTSPSAIHYFLERLAAEGVSPDQFAHLPAACLGYKTAQALTFGPRPLLARQATLPALVQSLMDYFDHA